MITQNCSPIYLNKLFVLSQTKRPVMAPVKVKRTTVKLWMRWQWPQYQKWK